MPVPKQQSKVPVPKQQSPATLYGIPGVEGVALRAVKLPADSVRGGLLTQARVIHKVSVPKQQG